MNEYLKSRVYLPKTHKNSVLINSTPFLPNLTSTIFFEIWGKTDDDDHSDKICCSLSKICINPICVQRFVFSNPPKQVNQMNDAVLMGEEKTLIF